LACCFLGEYEYTVLRLQSADDIRFESVESKIVRSRPEIRLEPLKLQAFELLVERLIELDGKA